MTADLRRWLLTVRQRRAELRLMEALGPMGEPARWPTRVRQRQPKPVPRGRWSRERRGEVIDDARQSGIEWSDAGLGLSRTHECPAATVCGHARVHVGVLGWNDLGTTRLIVFASVSDAADTRSRKVLLPPALARRLRGVLRGAGLVPDLVRSAKGGTSLGGRVSFSREVRSVLAATRASARVMQCLLRALGAAGS